MSKKLRYFLFSWTLLTLVSGHTAFATFYSLDSFSKGAQTTSKDENVSHNDGNIFNYEINAIDLQNKKIRGSFPAKTNNNSPQFFTLSLGLADEYKTTEIGKPELPIIAKWVDFDGNLSHIKIQITKDRASSGRYYLQEVGPYKIMPVQAPLLKTKEAETAAVASLDEKAYAESALYPAKDFRIVDVISVRGQKKALIHFYPIKYNAKQNILHVERNFAVTIKASNHPPRTSSTSDSYRGTLLVVVGAPFVNHPLLPELIKVKKELGYQVFVQKMSDIGSNDEDLRRFIQQLYRRSTPTLSHVLLIGDVAHIPAHNGIAGREASNNDNERTNQYTDHFYRAIDLSSYEADIGGPDLSVGRISVNTSEEFAIVAQKIIRYQRMNFSNFAWAQKASFVATDDRWQIAEATHNYVMDNYTSKWQQKGNYPASNQVGGDKLYAITHQAKTENLVSMFKEGRSIINYSGHGALTYWAGPYFKNENIQQLTDTNANPFVISNACITNSFAMAGGDCFGEMWLKHPKGAISFWGTTNNSYWDEDDVLEKKFFETFFQDNDKTLGHCTNTGLSAVWTQWGGAGLSRYYMEIYNITGDPTIELLSQVPTTPLLAHSTQLLIGQNELEVMVSDSKNRRPLAGVRVLLSRDEHYQQIASTNNDGVAIFNLDPDQIQVGDKLTLRALGFNVIPATSFIDVVNNTQSYMVHANHAFSVPFFSGSAGTLALQMKNVGSQNSGPITATIKTNSPLVSVSPSTLHFPSMAPGEMAAPLETLSFQAAKGIADESSITFSIEWTADNKEHKGKTSFRDKVSAPDVSVSLMKVSESHYQNGHLDPNEDGQFAVTIVNKGHAPLLAGEGVVTLASNNAQVSISEAEQVLSEDLAVGAEKKFIFPFHVAAIASGTEVLFTINTETEESIKHSFEESILVGTKMQETVFSQDNLPRAIPDANASGITALLTFTKNMRIDQVKVPVDITHTYIGDLTISLTSPSGKEVTLQEGTGGGADNIHCIYGESCTTVSDLNIFKNENAKGTWKIKVNDRAASDMGTLDRFGITIEGYQQ